MISSIFYFQANSDKGDNSGSGTSGFPPKSPPLSQFNMPAELFQVSRLYLFKKFYCVIKKDFSFEFSY